MARSTVDDVRKILKDLRKVTNTYRLYGREHPNTERTAAAFIRALLPVLDKLGRLELQCHADTLTLGEDVVYEDAEAGEFAEVLYREGIQQLTILPGVDKTELLSLVRLLSINLNLPGYEEETLISLLWQADLKHILYEAVQGLVEAVEQSETAAAGELGTFSDVLSHILTTQDDVSTLAADVPEGARAPSRARHTEKFEQARREAAHRKVKRAQGQEDTGRPPTPFSKALQEAAELAGVNKPVAWSKEQQSAVVETIEWAEGYRAEIDVPAEQLAEYWKSLGSDTFDSMLTSALEATVLLTAKPVRGLAQDEAANLCRRGAAAALESNSLDAFVSAMRSVDSLVAAEDFDDGGGALHQLQQEWSSPEMLSAVCAAAKSAGSDDEGLTAFIRGGGTPRALAVRDLLHRIDDEVQASTVMDALNESVRENPEVLAENIRDLDEDQLMPVYTCLARGDHPDFRRALRLGLRHPKPEVRVHALGLVLSQPDASNAEAIKPLLQDRDERVRITALRSFQGVSLPELVPTLKPEMAPGTFKGKIREEAKLLAQCFGASARVEAIPTFETILKHRRLGQLVANDRTDLEAAMWGLLATNSDEARLMVLRASKSFWPAQKQAAEKVMRDAGVRTAELERPTEDGEDA
jgi:hypothetical protein